MKNKKGFTLIEILVVVLIIGILAAIALPQYNMSIAKTKLSALKTYTQSLAEAYQGYFIIHGKGPQDILDLDITLSEKYRFTGSTKAVDINDEISCYIDWYDTYNYGYAGCSTLIQSVGLTYRIFISPSAQLRECVPSTEDQTHITSRLCSLETQKEPNIMSGYMIYKYR